MEAGLDPVSFQSKKNKKTTSLWTVGEIDFSFLSENGEYDLKSASSLSYWLPAVVPGTVPGEPPE